MATPPNSSNGIVLILLSLIGCTCGDVDTRVMRGAECNTDYKLLRMKIVASRKKVIQA